MDSKQLIDNHGVILYFTTPECNVCKVLKPKTRTLIENKFPKLNIHFIDVSQNPKLAADFHIFTVPAILVYFEKNEFIRKARNISLIELEKEISRPYHLLFES